MESLEELPNLTEEESAQKFRTATSLSWNLKAKEIQATKTPNYFIGTKKIENILIQMAFMVGLSSMWRFPYLCHRNGEGRFILTYFLLLLVLGIPLLYMEMMVGQWLRMDNAGVWKQLVPWLSGLGFASMLVCVLVSLYNSIIVSWSLFYLVQSFHYRLPWDHCPLVKNASLADSSCLRTVPHQYFWYHTALHASGHMEEGTWTLVPSLCLYLVATWVFLYFTVLIGGIKLSKLIPIVSIFLPNVLFICCLIRGLFLEGAVTSLRRMVTTELSTLASLDLWCQAGAHVLYSLGLGTGIIITFSCKIRGHSPVKMATFLALVNLATSMLTTSITFLMLGFWATTSGRTCIEKSVASLIKLISDGVLPQEAKPPENILLRPPPEFLDWIVHLPKHLQQQVAHLSLSCSILVQDEKLMEGPGLPYVAFSQVVSLLPFASVWAIFMFLALLMAELGTVMRILEGIILPLQSSIPVFTKHPRLVPVVVCLGGLLGSLIFTSNAGSYVMSLFDDYLVPVTLFVIVAFQNVALAWIYGDRYLEEMFGELGHLLWPSFSFLWKYLTPLGLLVLLGVCLMQLCYWGDPFYIAWNSSASREVRQPYGTVACTSALLLSAVTLLPILLYSLHQWWYLEDPVVSDTLEKPLALSSKPKPPLKKSTMSSQNRDKDSSERRVSPAMAKARASLWDSVCHLSSSLWPSSGLSSWSSVPPLGLFSPRSSTNQPMRETSLAVLPERTTEETPPWDTAQELATSPISKGVELPFGHVQAGLTSSAREETDRWADTGLPMGTPVHGPQEEMGNPRACASGAAPTLSERHGPEQETDKPAPRLD